MKKFIVLILVVITSFVFSRTAAFSAEKIYMPFFEMINIHYDYQYSTARLLKNYVDEGMRYELVIPSKPDTLVEAESFDAVKAKAQSLGCNYFIVGDLNRLGETVIVSINMYQTSDGALVWNDRLKAGTPEDIDPILQKIAHKLGTRQKAAEDGSIYNVTSYESQQLRQVQATNAFGVSIGGVYLASKAFADDPFAGGGGVFWYYDARDMLYEFDAQLYWLSNSSMGFVGINAYHPFFPESSTPFVGGGLGVGYTSYESDNGGYYYDPYGESPQNEYKHYDGSGLMFFVGGGYVFTRSSSVGLRAHLRYFVGSYSMDNPDKSLPHGLLLNLELYY